LGGLASLRGRIVSGCRLTTRTLYSRTKISWQAHKIKSHAKTAVDAESEFASNSPGHFVKTARPIRVMTGTSTSAISTARHGVHRARLPAARIM